ncbi:hypothetical protein N7451_011342 [Penicillium sp. IBT 35674x]|nr:hypothetical protein N7451_011342 [Penicillium sp. IBT 35674x]
MPKIVLFSYPGSPWGAKVTTYLALRGIEYSECHQPMTWPRPDLEQLNIRYRRIPFLAIGRDIYFDSLLIFEKLETLYPESALGAKEGSGRALEKLMEKWAEGTLLQSVICLLPKNLPLLTDSKFLKDRKELWGMDFSPEGLERGVSKSLVEVREQFSLLEDLLKDGRSWLLNTEKAGLIDIHAAFCFDWVMAGVLPNEFLSTDSYPNTLKWLERYAHTVAQAKAAGAAPTLLTGSDMVKVILESEFSESAGPVKKDPTGLQEGQTVALYRIDDVSSASYHRDVGRLVTLTEHEVALEIKAKAADVELRVHAPRWQFAVEAVDN